MYTLLVDTNIQACLQTSASEYSSTSSSPTVSDIPSSIPSPSSTTFSSTNMIPPSDPKIPEMDSSQFESPPEDVFSPEKVLADDDWGSLYFNPTFVGEYRIPSRDPKSKKKEDKDESEKQPTFSKPLSNNFVATSNSKSSPISTSIDFNIQTLEKTPSLTKMDNLCGPGFHILVKSGYNENGCGAQEQGIKVPRENNCHETTFGLG